MRASSASLAVLEIAIRGRGAAFAGPEPVGIHPDTHRTAGFAPVEPCGVQRIGDALIFGLSFDQPRSRHDHRLDVRCDMAAAYDSGGDAQIFDPRSEAHTSELQSLMRISYAVFCLKKKKK